MPSLMEFALWYEWRGQGGASIKPHTFQNGELKIEVGTTKAHNALGAPASLELTGSFSGFISED